MPGGLGCSSLAHAWVPLKTKPSTLSTARAGPRSVSFKGPVPHPEPACRCPSSEAGTGVGQGISQCGWEESGGWGTPFVLLSVASLGPAVALHASVSPSARGPVGSREPLRTRGHPPQWEGPPGDRLEERLEKGSGGGGPLPSWPGPPPWWGDISGPLGRTDVWTLGSSRRPPAMSVSGAGKTSVE